MMPIRFDIEHRFNIERKPTTDYSILMKWTDRPDLTIEIDPYDLDILIERAQYIRTQLGG